MEKEYARGKAETATELEKENKYKIEMLKKENKYKIEMLKKEYENTINRQGDKIESLQKEVEKTSTEKDLIQKKIRPSL